MTVGKTWNFTASLEWQPHNILQLRNAAQLITKIKASANSQQNSSFQVANLAVKVELWTVQGQE